jgi:hypothetical protein
VCEDRWLHQHWSRAFHRFALTETNGTMQLNIIVPVLMCCAMLWWIGRRISWTARLGVTAITWR